MLYIVIRTTGVFLGDEKHTIMKRTIKTSILRDTMTSFIETSTNHKGDEFSRKLEKGSADYSNACLKFHMNDVSLEVGNKVEG